MCFVTEVRNAHAVFTAYQRGARNLFELHKVTHLPLREIVDWLRAFNLPVHVQDIWRFDFPMRADVSFKALNQESM